MTDISGLAVEGGYRLCFYSGFHSLSPNSGRLSFGTGALAVFRQPAIALFEPVTVPADSALICLYGSLFICLCAGWLCLELKKLLSGTTSNMVGYWDDTFSFSPTFSAHELRPATHGEYHDQKIRDLWRLRRDRIGNCETSAKKRV